MRRYPVQPLLDATGLTLNGFIRTRMPSVNGVYYRKARDEGLSADQADRWAVAAGLVACNVWPELLDDAIEAGKVPCEECGEGFLPTRKGHRFCSKRCSNRGYQRERFRRLYRTDPEFREKERQRRAVYYEACAAYERARQARYRARREDAA